MKITKEIKKNPYLKVSNLLDKRDIKVALKIIDDLELSYGKKSKMLGNLRLKVWRKSLRMQKINQNK